MSGCSNNSFGDIAILFKNMFPDSKIAAYFAIWKDKTHYVVNHGIVPYFKEMLVNEAKKTPCYVMPFDKSLNEKRLGCHMDQLVRFWDILSNQVKLCYWDSSFIGHSTATDILGNFLEALKTWINRWWFWFR